MCCMAGTMATVLRSHALTVGDVFIRNVPTDIRSGYGWGSDAVMQKDGNSIFIFEVAGLCIGHLGHLHHPLTRHVTPRLVGSTSSWCRSMALYTLSLDGMSEITRRLRASIVLPMHRFSTPLSEFITRMKGQFEVDLRKESSFSISLETLPKTPTIIILDGV